MRPNYRTRLSLVCAVLLLASACRVSNPNLTGPQIAAYQVNRTVAALSEANKAVAFSVVKLNELKLVSNDTTNEVLNYNRATTKAVRTTVSLLQQNKPWVEVAPEVLSALKGIPLPRKVSEFLNNPTNDQGMLALVSAINTTQLLIRQGIREAQK